MDSPSLISIPAELRLTIFLSLCSPADIRSLMRTSREYNGIFNEFRDTILTVVLQNAISQEALSTACFAHNMLGSTALEKLAFGDPEQEEPSEDDRLRCMEAYTQEPKASPFLELKLQSTDLYKLWALTHKHVDAYVPFAFANIRKLVRRLDQIYLISMTGAGPEQGLSRPLSETERARLYRAFFRFEVCRKIVNGNAELEPAGSSSSNAPSRDDAAAWLQCYLSQFSSFELMEIWCVFEYIVDRISQVIEDLEDSLRSGRHSLPNEIAAAQVSMGLDGSRMGTRSWARHLAELGLPFLDKFLRMSFHERLDLYQRMPFRQHWETSTEDNLHIALMARYQDGADESDSEDPEDPDWCWDEDVLLKWRPHLRPTGYIFWDKERLVRSGMLAFTVEQVLSAFQW